MGIVLFVPGLQGENAIKNPGPFELDPESNEAAVRRAAAACGWQFHKAAYQNIVHPTPLLSVMEHNFADQLNKLQKDFPCAPVLIVGSSVGFGVVLGGLTLLQSSTSAIALLGYKPIPDPLLAIQLQINKMAPDALDALRTGHIPKISMPVEGANGDTFPLTNNHIFDPEAHRFLTHSSSRDAFNERAGANLQQCIILYGREDHLTPEKHMNQFCQAVAAVDAQPIALEGGHGANLTAQLQSTCQDMILHLS